MIFKNGFYKKHAYFHSPKRYHLICWSLVLIDFVVVWALRAAPPIGSLSYGPVNLWTFCWISNEYVILGSFFVMTGVLIVVIFALGLYVVVVIIRVRAKVLLSFVLVRVVFFGFLFFFSS
jgi:hypothetical protein